MNGSEWVPEVYNASFTFSIASFSYEQSTTQLIGTGVWKAIGAITFTASYNNGPPNATPYISHTGWGNLNMTGAGYVGPTNSTEAVDYPASAGGNKAFTLNATDGETPDTDVERVYFYNKRFWGTTTKADTYTEADIEGLANNELSNSRSKTFTVTAAATYYILYSYPSRLGAATFYVGGFEGGFEAPETVSVTNSAGFAENYYAYRSTNAGLGETQVVVT